MTIIAYSILGRTLAEAEILGESMDHRRRVRSVRRIGRKGSPKPPPIADDTYAREAQVLRSFNRMIHQDVLHVLGVRDGWFSPVLRRGPAFATLEPSETELCLAGCWVAQRG